MFRLAGEAPGSQGSEEKAELVQLLAKLMADSTLSLSTSPVRKMRGCILLSAV